MNIFCGLLSRRRVIQVFARGARILDGAFMTQDLSFKSSNSDASAASEGTIVSSVSIADPYVLLRMTDGSIQLLVGGMWRHLEFNVNCFSFINGISSK